MDGSTEGAESRQQGERSLLPPQVPIHDNDTQNHQEETQPGSVFGSNKEER